jgi:hypothetical protein
MVDDKKESLRKNRNTISSSTQRTRKEVKGQKVMVDQFMKAEDAVTTQRKKALQRNKSDPTARFHHSPAKITQDKNILSTSSKLKSSTQSTIKLSNQLYSKKSKNAL